MLSSIKILVINLDEEKERWKSVRVQEDRFGLHVIRIPAVQIFDVDESEIKFVTKGVRAVWRSHMNCMKYLCSSKDSHLIIAEDDFDIRNHKLLNRVLSDPDIYKYDVVQLGWVVPGLDTRLSEFYSNVEHTLFRRLFRFIRHFNPESQQLKRLRISRSGKAPDGFIPDNFLPGGQFYLISKSFAQSIQLLNDPQFLATDDMYIALARMRSFKFIRCSRNLVRQKPFPKWGGSRFRL